jgi:hypothetical protein
MPGATRFIVFRLLAASLSLGQPIALGPTSARTTINALKLNGLSVSA